MEVCGTGIRAHKMEFRKSKQNARATRDTVIEANGHKNNGLARRQTYRGRNRLFFLALSISGVTGRLSRVGFLNLSSPSATDTAGTMVVEQLRFPPGPVDRYSPSEDLFSWMKDNFARYGDIYKASIYG